MMVHTEPNVRKFLESSEALHGLNCELPVDCTYLLRYLL
jgi:hypothetical protein